MGDFWIVSKYIQMMMMMQQVVPNLYVLVLYKVVLGMKAGLLLPDSIVIYDAQDDIYSIGQFGDRGVPSTR